jgi:ABC-2 type transport system ATP-binding protein
MPSPIPPSIILEGIAKYFKVPTAPKPGAWNKCKSFLSPTLIDFKAVDGITFKISPGERVALIGPNGAGKSTTIKMITGILEPTSGTLQVAGLVPTTQRAALSYKIGCVFGQRSQLWSHLTAKESYDVLRVMFKVSQNDYLKRIDELSSILGLQRLLSKRPSSMSLGERMKCELVAALIHQPEILFLDEPSIGLDLLAKISLRELLVNHGKKYGTTILFTSHDMADIEGVCDRVILINHGRVVCDLPTKILKQKTASERMIIAQANELPINEILFPQGLELESSTHGQYEFLIDTKILPIEKAVSYIFSLGPISDLTIAEASLEEIIAKLYREVA